MFFKYDIYWNNPTGTKLTVSPPSHQKKEGGAKTLRVSWYVLSVSRAGLNRFLDKQSSSGREGGCGCDISPQCDVHCRPVANIDLSWRLRPSEGGGVDVFLLSLRGGGGGGGGVGFLLTNHLQDLVLSLYREQMKRDSVIYKHKYVYIITKS